MRVSRLQALIGIIVLSLVALYVVWPQEPSNYLPGFIPWPKSQGIHLALGNWRFDRQGMRLGLDLQGGTNLVYEADLSQAPQGRESEALDGAMRNIERRINAYGVAEPVIQTVGSNRISLQLPGVKDIEEAKSLIGKTALLDFREPMPNDTGELNWVKAAATGSDGQEKALTGAYFKPNAQVIFEPQTSKPQVSFELNDEGAKLFEQITTRLQGQPLGIFLDNELISAPTVKAVIKDRGIIEGLTIDEARTLSIQLNSGALPVPINIVKEQSVDATLGADSVRKSVLAGEIGLAIVVLFMILYYRFPGLLAGVALLIYTMVVLSIFKLVPVTLTLAGIAAFILSVGMAVDANILIFERMKEEVRMGRTLRAAVETGFARAWPSIRDSNISTFITCIILYWFGANFGASLVMGFAVTLFIGVAFSMFTAIVITRTFLHFFVGTALAQSSWIFGLETSPQTV